MNTRTDTASTRPDSPADDSGPKPLRPLSGTDGSAGTLSFANNLSLAGGNVLWDLKTPVVVGGGTNDLVSDAGTKDEAPWFFEAYLGASHLADAESYWQASPLRLVRGITAPLAIVHSEEDRRCSIGQAEELFMALKLLDREVELIRFPGEGHELTRSGSPVHRLQRLEILLEWFGRWLRG